VNIRRDCCAKSPGKFPNDILDVLLVSGRSRSQQEILEKLVWHEKDLRNIAANSENHAGVKPELSEIDALHSREIIWKAIESGNCRKKRKEPKKWRAKRFPVTRDELFSTSFSFVFFGHQVSFTVHVIDASSPSLLVFSRSIIAVAFSALRA
jgi:hypothetical protein